MIDNQALSSPEITVVSGLPRSGTSLMMQILVHAGMEAVTDAVRAADTDNPRGYYEFEPVKKTKQDASWVAGARGKVVKMVSSLLYDLPATEQFRVIFMQREMEEVLESQEKMLVRLGNPTAPRDLMTKSFRIHLDRLFEWLPRQPHLRVLIVNYNNVIANPQLEVDKIIGFLGIPYSPEKMVEAIDPSLYRNRK